MSNATQEMNECLVGIRVAQERIPAIVDRFKMENPEYRAALMKEVGYLETIVLRMKRVLQQA